MKISKFTMILPHTPDLLLFTPDLLIRLSDYQAVDKYMSEVRASMGKAITNARSLKTKLQESARATAQEKVAAFAEFSSLDSMNQDIDATLSNLATSQKDLGDAINNLSSKNDEAKKAAMDANSMASSLADQAQKKLEKAADASEHAIQLNNNLPSIKSQLDKRIQFNLVFAIWRNKTQVLVWS